MTDLGLASSQTKDGIPETCGFYIWGANEFGNLGLGHLENEYFPRRIKNSGTEDGMLVGCGGFHLVLVTQSGDVFVSGRNDEGQLGIGQDDEDIEEGTEEETKCTIPVLIDLPMQNLIIHQVCCGFGHTLLLTSSGRVLAFGNNTKGECGVGSLQHAVVSRPMFLEITTTANKSQQQQQRIHKMASKGFHSLLLGEDGSLWGFGLNDCFQLGLEEEVVVDRPTPIPMEERIKDISCGVYHSHCMDVKDRVWVFGDNSMGQLGLATGPGEEETPSIPIVLNFPVPIHHISCGFAHTLIVDKTSWRCWSWGSNRHGQLGTGQFDPPYITQPHLIELEKVESVECGYNTSFLWVSETGLFACGTNENGELGLGLDVEDQPFPVRVPGVPACQRVPRMVASNFTVLLPSSNFSQQLLLPIPSVEKLISPKFKRRYSNTVVVKHGLSEDFGRILFHDNIAWASDVSLQASADRGLFPVHRALVTARCVRLGRVIESKTGNNNATDRNPVVILPKLTSDTLKRLLVYLYTGRVQIDDASISEILLLSSCAQTLQADELFALCVEEIRILLTNDNVVLVLREACELSLLSIKRCCMEYIQVHFAACVSAANRQVVETLENNPELLSEVVGLSSPDFAHRLISALPEQVELSSTTANSLERDLQHLFESEDFADVTFQCCANEESKEVFLCHRFVLIARCPFFASSFQALYKLKEDGDAAAVSLEDRKRVNLIFPDHTVDSEGRIVVMEINKSTASAIKCFLLYLYTDRVDAVNADVASDVLQMTCIYGLAQSALAQECESIMKSYIHPGNALDTLCIAQQLGLSGMRRFAMEYLVEHFVECMDASLTLEEDALRDCIFDFPQLGVALLRAVGSRLKENNAQHVLMNSETNF